MATEELLQSLSLPAAADLSASQFCGIAVDSSGNGALCGVGASNVAIGILQDKADAAGRAAQVGVFGKSKAKLGATVAAGAKVTTDSTGRFITATTGDFIAGICTLGGAVNTLGEVFIKNAGKL